MNNVSHLVMHWVFGQLSEIDLLARIFNIGIGNISQSIG